MTNKGNIKKLERLLGSSSLEEHIHTLEDISGKTKAIDQLLLMNENRIDAKLKQLGLKKDSYAEDVYLALFNEIERMNHGIQHALGDPDYASREGLETILAAAFDAVNHDDGFFLKEDKMREMLLANPPKNITKFTRYKSFEALLKKEPVKEVMAILRFSETGEWMNGFLEQYRKLVPDDFERRPIELIVLDPNKWYEAARDFIKKKLHNMSHLKEMGVIFGVPEPATPLGQTLKIFQLTIHYYFEVHMYSDFFSSVKGEELGANLTKVVQADIIDPPKRQQKEVFWRVIQRYLTKLKDPDPRIFEPHLNSEVLHWRLATDRFIELGDIYHGLNIETWDGLDHAGDFFPSKQNGELFVDFNLEDNVLSCCEFLPAIGAYHYHYKEDMWNAIFDVFFSEQMTRSIIFKNIARGYFTESDLREIIP